MFSSGLAKDISNQFQLLIQGTLTWMRGEVELVWTGGCTLKSNNATRAREQMGNEQNSYFSVQSKDQNILLPT